MHASLTRLPLIGADVFLLDRIPFDLNPQSVFEELRRTLPWKQENVTIRGRSFPQPRLTTWHGDEGAAYTYSGLSLPPEPWTPLLERLRAVAEELTGASFNSVLANAYRDERSSIGFHSDNEPELGRNPTIASMSFGAEREFVMRPRFRKDLPEQRIPLPSGSLLVMAGQTQRNWLHGVEKEKRPIGPRINLTFRKIWR